MNNVYYLPLKQNAVLYVKKLPHLDIYRKYILPVQEAAPGGHGPAYVHLEHFAHAFPGSLSQKTAVPKSTRNPS